MPVKKLDYDRVARSFDRRYQASPQAGIQAALRELVERLQPARVLEAGCGTGHWWAGLRATGRQLHGLDLSAGMLGQARAKTAQGAAGLNWVQGRAEALPYPAGVFDLVYCVNALHHFEQPQEFIAEVRRVLRAGGALAVIGMARPEEKSVWYLYQYFEGVFEMDRERYPSWGTVLDWMAAAGFQGAEWRQAEHVSASMAGRAVFADPFLRYEATSQLTLLSPEEYNAGLERMRRVVQTAEGEGREILFPVEIQIDLLAAWTAAGPD